MHDHLFEGLGINALPLVITEYLCRVLVVRNLVYFQILVVSAIVLFLEAELFDAVTIYLELFMTELVDA